MSGIVVLMSTYNGERYLREQLDSIFTQKDVDVCLSVRDDGSKDSTLEILCEYKKKYEGRMEILKGENIGWKKSFFELIRHAAVHYTGYNYFAFSDQDDIWLEEKLTAALSGLDALDCRIALYCSNQYYYKDGENLGAVWKRTPVPTAKNCLVRNCSPGCTMAFTKGLLDMMARYDSDHPAAHDYWAYQVAVLCGKVYVDENSYIYYRQHENNQIGITGGFRQLWRRRLKTAASSNRKRERQAKELYNLYRDDFSEEGRLAVEKIRNYRKSLKNRFGLLTDNDYTLGKRSNDFWFKLRIILGIA